MGVTVLQPCYPDEEACIEAVHHMLMPQFLQYYLDM